VNDSNIDVFDKKKDIGKKQLFFGNSICCYSFKTLDGGFYVIFPVQAL